MCFSSITLTIEKDWVVILSAGDSEWLAHTNSVMSQIDLLCESLGPALMGLIFMSVQLNVAALLARYLHNKAIYR